jgi:hypothetical protein
MTGMRGEPCEYLYQMVHIKTGETKWLCDKEICEGPIGSWCPIEGDSKYHIIKV